MSSRKKYAAALFLSIFAASVLLPSLCLAGKKPHLTFDHYYDGPAVEKALRDLAEAYPGFAGLESIGKSEEGRDIWLITITNGNTGGALSKPGIYVDGAIHGNEIQATEVCLYLAWYLLDSYGEVPMITELVDKRTFYIIPIVNVDSRARFFEDAGGYQIGRTGRVPYDDDGDGLVDEDDYDDLDGDGMILQMRIRDDFGDYKTHPDDERVMVRVEPGERGEWRLLGSEGIDNDGDGRLNEDVPGYLDMNRNYGFKWQPPYVQRGAGNYPLSGMVTKAITDFVMTKPNIVFNFAFHNYGGMILRGPGSKLAGMYSPRDVAVYDYLGEEGEKIVPGYRYMVGGKELYTTHGDFDEFMYSALGIYGFVGELYMRSQEAYREPGEEEDEGEEGFGRRGSGERDVARQKFNDNVSQGTMFSEWKKYDHPQFGEIELGGWKTFTTRIGPAFLLQEMVHRNASLVLFTAKNAPEITVEEIEVTGIDGGLTRIRVRASNGGAIPSLSSKAVSKMLARLDMITIEGKGIEVVSGGIIRDLHFDRVEPVRERPWMIFTSIGSFGKTDVQWVVRGSGKVKIKYDSVKAENRELELKI